MIASELSRRLRHDIIARRYDEGVKLPTREEFSRDYNVSKTTVQKAMSRLEKEGFVISRGVLGTFVNPRSPNTTDLAVVIPAKESQLTREDEFLNIFRVEKVRLEALLGKALRFYFIDREQRTGADFLRVAQEASETRLAGVIFPMPPEPWMLEPFRANGIPAVVFTDKELQDVSTVWVDYEGMFRRMLAFCQASHCTAPALLTNERLPNHCIESYCAAAKELGIPVADHMIQGIPLGLPDCWFRHTLSAFFAGVHPADAILVADVIHLPRVFTFLLERGMIPGRNIKVLSHCTFSQMNPPQLPVQYFGFSVDDILLAMADAIEAIRAGNPPKLKFRIVRAVEPKP